MSDEKPQQDPGEDVAEAEPSVNAPEEGVNPGNASPATDAESSDSSATGDGPNGGGE